MLKEQQDAFSKRLVALLIQPELRVLVLYELEKESLHQREIALAALGAQVSYSDCQKVKKNPYSQEQNQRLKMEKVELCSILLLIKLPQNILENDSTQVDLLLCSKIIQQVSMSSSTIITLVVGIQFLRQTLKRALNDATTELQLVCSTEAILPHHLQSVPWPHHPSQPLPPNLST